MMPDISASLESPLVKKPELKAMDRAFGLELVDQGGLLGLQAVGFVLQILVHFGRGQDPHAFRGAHEAGIFGDQAGQEAGHTPAGCRRYSPGRADSG